MATEHELHAAFGPAPLAAWKKIAIGALIGFTSGVATVYFSAATRVETKTVVEKEVVRIQQVETVKQEVIAEKQGKVITSTRKTTTKNGKTVVEKKRVVVLPSRVQTKTEQRVEMKKVAKRDVSIDQTVVSTPTRKRWSLGLSVNPIEFHDVTQFRAELGFRLFESISIFAGGTPSLKTDVGLRVDF